MNFNIKALGSESKIGISSLLCDECTKEVVSSKEIPHRDAHKFHTGQSSLVK